MHVPRNPLSFLTVLSSFVCWLTCQFIHDIRSFLPSCTSVHLPLCVHLFDSLQSKLEHLKDSTLGGGWRLAASGRLKKDSISFEIIIITALAFVIIRGHCESDLPDAAAAAVGATCYSCHVWLSSNIAGHHRGAASGCGVVAVLVVGAVGVAALLVFLVVNNELAVASVGVGRVRRRV